MKRRWFLSQGAVAALAVESAWHADSLKRVATLHDRLKPTCVPAVRRLGERLVAYQAVS